MDRKTFLQQNLTPKTPSTRTDSFGMPLIQTNSSPTPSKGTNGNYSGSVTGTKITDATPKSENISEIDIIKNDLKALKGAFYKNNTPSNQDFVKSSRFTNRVRLPIYATAPTTCAIGEVYVNSASGKLYVCSASNTWSLVGTQV